MTEPLISLAEAASLLGVSKETLRNWDRAGKLKSCRHPINGYRLYALEDVKRVMTGTNRSRRAPAPSPPPSHAADENEAGANHAIPLDRRDLRRFVAKANRALRDTDANSSLVERLDEFAKLLFTKMLAERAGSAEVFGSGEGNQGADPEVIRRLFDQYSQQYPRLFPPRFARVKLSDSAVRELGRLLGTVELAQATHDLKGLAFEEMIRGTFDKGDNQQFFTPDGVVEFLVSMMAPFIKGRVCDPACGTGGFLVKIASSSLSHEELVGLEIDERLAWLTGINLFLHGAKNYRAELLSNGGTLGASGRNYAEDFDVILTNPPFGSDFSEPDELEGYELGRGRTSRRRGILFLERCLSMLREGGYLGIVIDDGVLSSASTADVRDFLIKNSEILAVISLPETAFMPYASVSASILVLRKAASPSRSQQTFFAQAEKTGRKPNGDPDIVYDSAGQPRIDSDLPQIVAQWNEYLAGKFRSPSEHIFIANPFVLMGDEAEANRLDFLYHHPARLTAKRALERCPFPLVSLSELCDERSEAYVPSTDLVDQFIPYTGLANIEPKTGVATQDVVPASALKSAVKKYYPGDILFSKMRPALRKCSLITFSEPGYASSECMVLVPRVVEGTRPVIEASLLSILLRSDLVFGQIVHQISGIGRPRIGPREVRCIRIPVPPAATQAELRTQFEKSEVHYQALRQEAIALLKKSSALELDAIEQVALGFLGT